MNINNCLLDLDYGIPEFGGPQLEAKCFIKLTLMGFFMLLISLFLFSDPFVTKLQHEHNCMIQSFCFLVQMAAICNYSTEALMVL